MAYVLWLCISFIRILEKKTHCFIKSEDSLATKAVKAPRTNYERTSWSSEGLSSEFTSSFVSLLISLYIKKHLRLLLHRYIKYFSLVSVIKENPLSAYSWTSSIRPVRLQGLYSELVFPSFIQFSSYYYNIFSISANMVKMWWRIYFLPLSLNDESN
jgi:hypothetical protein